MKSKKENKKEKITKKQVVKDCVVMIDATVKGFKVGEIVQDGNYIEILEAQGLLTEIEIENEPQEGN